MDKMVSPNIHMEQIPGSDLNKYIRLREKFLSMSESEKVRRLRESYKKDGYYDPLLLREILGDPNARIAVGASIPIEDYFFGRKPKMLQYKIDVIE